jgi:hypothetical protein
MRAKLLAVMVDGLCENPTQASAELTALGVRPGALDQLKQIKATDVESVAERTVMTLDVNYAALAQIHTEGELLSSYLQHGASNELITEMLGFSARQISVQRAALGHSAQNGRPVALDTASADAATSTWRDLAYLPKAPRLLAVHDRMPIWPLSSLYAALRNK